MYVWVFIIRNFIYKRLKLSYLQITLYDDDDDDDDNNNSVALQKIEGQLASRPLFRRQWRKDVWSRVTSLQDMAYEPQAKVKI